MLVLFLGFGIFRFYVAILLIIGTGIMIHRRYVVETFAFLLIGALFMPEVSFLTSEVYCAIICVCILAGYFLSKAMQLPQEPLSGS